MDSSVSVMKKLLDQGQIAINERNDLVDLVTEIVQDSFMMNCLIAYTGKNNSPSIDITKLAPPQVLVKNRVDVSVIRGYLLRSKMCLKAHLEESTGACLKEAQDRKEIDEITQRMSMLVDPDARISIQDLPPNHHSSPSVSHPSQPEASASGVTFVVPEPSRDTSRETYDARTRSSHRHRSRSEVRDRSREKSSTPRPKKKHSAQYKTNFWTGKRELVYN